jgi:hypothetical protein
MHRRVGGSVGHENHTEADADAPRPQHPVMEAEKIEPFYTDHKDDR